MPDNISYDSSRRKEYKSGLFVMPMSKGSPALVRLHEPYEVIATAFDVVGKDGMPSIPSPDVKDEDMLSGVIDVGVPTNHVTYVTYRVRGEYWHIPNKTGGLLSMDVGINPQDKGFFPPAKLKPSFFVSLVGLQKANSEDQGF